MKSRQLLHIVPILVLEGHIGDNNEERCAGDEVDHKLLNYAKNCGKGWA